MCAPHCADCGTRDRAAFYQDTSRSCGLDTYCRACKRRRYLRGRRLKPRAAPLWKVILCDRITARLSRLDRWRLADRIAEFRGLADVELFHRVNR
jgi:hypothetical protein